MRGGEIRGEPFRDTGEQIRILKGSRERDVETEKFEDEVVAPGAQIPGLCFRKGTAAGDVSLADGSPETVGLTHAGALQGLKGSVRFRRSKGQEASAGRDVAEFERRGADGAEAPRYAPAGIPEIVIRDAGLCLKGRLQRSVHPVMGRGFCHGRPGGGIKAFRHNLRHRLPCQDVTPQKGRKEPVLFRAGSGNPVEGAALMGKAFVHAYTTILRSRWESMSKMVTTTTMQMSTAQVRGKSKLRMSSQRTRPMPPAPTMPMTVAERTLDSKR